MNRSIARRWHLGIGVALAGVALTTGVLPTAGNAPTAADAVAQDQQQTRFVVDSVHSMVMFRIKHLGVAYNYGLFHQPEGAFNIDLDDPSNSFIDISVRTNNVDTGNDSRDNHLRSEDFFDVKRHPRIRFKADEFEKVDDDTLRATGELTMVGETREITIEITHTGEGSTRQGYKQGIEAEFTIERSKWGMDTYVENGALGDEVTLMVTMEGQRE